MNGQSNPDERFNDVYRALNELVTSQRHLLTAQVLLNDRMDRAEAAIQNSAETLKELAEQEKHSAAKLEALIDIVRRWYERHGNGAGLEPA